MSETIADWKAWTLIEPPGKRSYTVLRIRTAGGVDGYGECGPLPDGMLVKAMESLKGAAATALESAAARLERFPHASGAVNIALLDICAKLARASVYQFLGGPTRARARALTALEGDSDEQVLAAMMAAGTAGHRAFLAPLAATRARNHGQQLVKAVLARLEKLRAAAGENVDFVLDGAGRLSPGDAAAVARAVEKFHVLWFDEPCGAANLAGAAKISAECVTPLGFGRTLARGGDYQDLLREQAVDVLRPDTSRHGITGIRKLAALAETYYTAVAPFHDGGPVATAAALHLAASIPNFFIQQIPAAAGEARKFRDAVAGAGLERVSEGYAALPEAPGLGIRVDEAFLTSQEVKR